MWRHKCICISSFAAVALASLAPKLEESLAKTSVAPPVSEDTEDQKVSFDHEEDLGEYQHQISLDKD